MGYVSSGFVRVQEPRAVIDRGGVISYDPQADVYVSFFRDGVEVGHLFRADKPPERFPLDLGYESAVDASAAILRTRVEGDALLVDYTHADGSRASARFRPEVLAR
jgi:hypothetical protein